MFNGLHNDPDGPTFEERDQARPVISNLFDTFVAVSRLDQSMMSNPLDTLSAVKILDPAIISNLSDTLVAASRLARAISFRGCFDEGSSTVFFMVSRPTSRRQPLRDCYDEGLRSEQVGGGE